MSNFLNRYRRSRRAPTPIEKIAEITDPDELEGFRLTAIAREAMTDELHMAIRERERELKK